MILTVILTVIFDYDFKVIYMIAMIF